jgi:transposase
MLAEHLARLIALQPFQTITRLVQTIHAEGLQCSRSKVFRAMKYAGLSFKVATLRTLPCKERIHAARLAFADVVQGVDYAKVVSIDETSFDTNMFSRRGYALQGERLCRDIVVPRRERCSLVLAISADGDFTSLIISGSANTQTFVDFIHSMPLASNSHVLLDNVAFHKSKRCAETFQEMGYTPVFTPPYSPEANPIENVFSELKTAYRSWASDNATNAETQSTPFINRLQTFVDSYFEGRRRTLRSCHGRSTLAFHGCFQAASEDANRWMDVSTP